MTMEELAVDQAAEQAVLGALLLNSGRHVSGLVTRGLRPHHFYFPQHGAVFTACISLADRQAAVDVITIVGELERLGLRGGISRGKIDELSACAPSAGNYGDYADIVIEMARWRERRVAVHDMNTAIAKRDATAWSKAQAQLESATAGTRTESYSPEAWAALMFDYFAASKEEANEYAVPLPWPRLNEAMAGGLCPGEWMALSGPTNFGKSVVADQWLDFAADRGKRCHLYMTEMAAVARGMRYLSRRTGVPFLRQKARVNLTDQDRKAILAELQRFNWGCTVAADWNEDDIVRDALAARFDFVVVDLLHGMHYEDERGLDRLSKAMQRLAHVSTTIDGHNGTAVLAVTHLKEEGMIKGRVPRPTITSIKGGSSIKQDADAVMFCWREQEEGGAPLPEGELWLAKGRGSARAIQEVTLNDRRFRFDLRAGDELTAQTTTATEPSNPDMPF